MSASTDRIVALIDKGLRAAGQAAVVLDQTKPDPDDTASLTAEVDRLADASVTLARKLIDLHARLLRERHEAIAQRSAH